VQLRVLQDKLPPFSHRTGQGRSRRKSWACRSVAIFSEFSEPVAAPPLSAAGAPRLTSRRRPKEDVAVKVPPAPVCEKAFRKMSMPSIWRRVWLNSSLPRSRRLRPMEVIEHSMASLRGELDLRARILSAASEFAREHKATRGFQLPAIKWNYSPAV